MENRSVSYPRGGSFLNDSSQNRFKSFQASKTNATKRTNAKTKLENVHRGEAQLLSSSFTSSPMYKQSHGIKFDNVFGMKTSKKPGMQSKLVYSLIVFAMFYLFVGLDKDSSTSEFKDEIDEVSQLVSKSQSREDALLKEFTSNKVESQYTEGALKNMKENIFHSNNKMYIGGKTRNQLHQMTKVESSQLDQVTNQLMDALNPNDEKNIHLTITVGNNEDKKTIRSGLKPSPGIPLPGQNLNMLGSRGRRIFKPSKSLLSKIKTYSHQISSLNCVLYNGPEYNVAQEVVYWEDIPIDSSYGGTFFHVDENSNDEEVEDAEKDSLNKYLTFQPDTGGFNNNRMAFETALVLSVAMGRILVLPPRQQFPLMSAGSHKEQLISFEDVFHLDSLNKEFESVNIITMKEFLIRENLQPPGNKTNWDGSKDLNQLWKYLEHKAYVPTTWNRNECIVAFPSTPDNYGNNELMNMLQKILSGEDGREFPHHLDFQGKPIPADAPSIERLREMMAGRSKLCLYTEQMQSSTIIHLPTKPPHQRLLTHFYSWIYFDDWTQSNWIKRLIRDHIRYSDEIMCAAARIVEGMRQTCYSRMNPNGMYHSVHIRRKDFHVQGLNYSITSDEILLSLSGLAEGSCIFVATDDFDQDFFKPIREQYNSFNINDFKELLNGINPNFYGMIEQVVVARGEQFHGSFYSTFSGYVNRLRGYFSILEMVPGSTEGILRNSFYMPTKFRNENKIYKAIQKPFFAREFPSAWRDIGNGVN